MLPAASLLNNKLYEEYVYNMTYKYDLPLVNFDDFDDAHDKPVFVSHEIEPQFQVNLENKTTKSEHSSSSSKKQLTFQAKIFPEPNLQLGQSNNE